MVLNQWLRGKEIANTLGLLCGSVAIIITGNQIQNSWILLLGTISTSMFTMLCIVMVVLAFRDAILYPKEFFVSLPWKIKKKMVKK